MSKYILKFICFISLFCTIAGCHAVKPSSTHEAPNSYNRPSDLGLTGPFPWSTLKEDPKSFRLENTPWTDTYWPTYLKGLSYRYRSDNKPRGYDIFSLNHYLVTLRSTLNENEKQLANLSPAEKHDLVRQVMGNLPTIDEATWNDLLNEAEAIDIQANEHFAKIDANGELSDEEIRSQKLEAVRNAIKAGANLLQNTPSFSTAFRLTTAEWRKWARLASYSDNQIDARSISIGNTNITDSTARNWGWEGICHGWAPAAIFSAEPKHAVIANLEPGQEVLLTEGDIRGMLSKAWADQSPWNDQTFIGSRCDLEPDDIINDQFGRSLDAKIACETCGLDNQGVSFEREFSVADLPAYRIRIFDSNEAAQFIIRTRWGQTRNGYTDYDFFYGLHFKSFAMLRQWIEEGADMSAQEEIRVNRQGQCRDVNPMTFHLLLTKVMPNGQGFVIDRTGTMQVWNQPVKGFDLEFQVIEGSNLAADELTPVSSLNDFQWQVRAPGTRYLLQAEATLLWVTENGPHTSYSYENGDLDDDALRLLRLTYTLEFDENKNLIGGEWGPVPTNQRTADQARSFKAPDFIYYFSKDAEPMNTNSSVIDYNQVVRQLHDCSLSTDNVETSDTHTDQWGLPLKFTRCSINP